MFRLLTVLVLASALELVGGCRWRSSTAGKHSASLLIAPSAIDPKYLAYPDGREQLTYVVDTEYPAESTIAFLSTQLRNQRWTALREDFMNPGIPTSEVRGWTQFGDASREPRASVRAWACDWEDEAHNITLYMLEYRYPMSGAHDPPDSRMLHVMALYIPAAVAEKMKHVTRPDQPKK
jgi:hypothetical protein